LPEYTLANNFVLTWGGTDNLSGIKNYDLQYKVGDGPWLNASFNPTMQTSYHVTGVQNGITYYFRARATDNVGNVQPWSANAQTQTTIILEPVSEILPFNPPVLKPTDPITDSFVVRWQGFTAPGTSITRYDVYYQYNGGAWQTWNNFTGSETSATFVYQNGDGRYGFEVVATNSLNQTETRNFVAEQTMLVDLADAIVPVAILPLIADQTEID
ncbi:MAG: fibronectin type III domain-containing protein, partial [Candidatus Promineifilaceae bacterium]